MIPPEYIIHLYLEGARWYWCVDEYGQDADECPEAMGDSGDYSDACRAAHAAHDRLVAESGER